MPKEVTMKRSVFEIEKNIPLTKDVFEMVLNGDTSGITNAGQFVNILLDGYYLIKSTFKLSDIVFYICCNIIYDLI